MCVHPTQSDTAAKDAGFQIWSSAEGRWHLSGQVDVAEAEAFRAAVHTAAEGSVSLSLDCTRLRFIDVAGMRALAQAAHGAGASVQVYGASETLRRCWKLLEWDNTVLGVELCA